MRQKVFSILALLLMAATGAKAETVTWTASDMADTELFIDFEKGDAANNTIKGITVTASSGGKGAWQFNYINMEEGSTTITFTSSVGNIKSIAITAEIINTDGSTPSGWTLSDGSELSWSGDASPTVSMTLSDWWEIYSISDIVFTIESSTVNVTGITLDKTEASMIVGGETLSLTATVAPNDATDKTVTWTTSDASVATVTDGVVTAVAAGTATITATATNGTADTSDDKTATCTVTVTEPAAAIFAIDTDGTTQDFGSVEADATAQKTFTITNSGNKPLFVTISNPADFTAEMTHNAADKNVYFTDALGWGDIHVYYWNNGPENGPEWPGAAMTELYTNELDQKVYYYELPDDVEGVIFNGNGNQTGDIFEAIGKAYYTTGEMEYGNKYTVGTWSYNNCVPAGKSSVLTVTMNTATLGSKSGNITLSFDAKNATSFTIPCTGETVATVTNYNVTMAEGSNAHGTVTFTVGGVAADKAKKDDVVTVSVTPAEGYSLKGVTAKTSSQEVVPMTNGENGWTFTMPEDNVTVTVTYTKNLQDAWIQDIADQTYTGSAITPTVNVKEGETTLVLNTDYTVAYSNNEEIGTATVTVTGTGNYSGTATANFTIVADKSALNTAITEAETYYNSIKDDHAEAAAALKTAIDDAKEKQGNADASQDDVNNALSTLTTAKTTAEETVLDDTKTELGDAITEAEAYYESIKDSNPTAAAALKTAIDDAKAAKNNGTATQAEVDAALAAIATAKTTAEQTVLTETKTALNDAIAEAEAYYNSIKDSNPAAAATLLQAINAAKAVKDNADATQEQVDDAIADLAGAKTTTEDTVLTETKTALNDAIAEAEAYYNSIKDSNPAAAATLLQAINAAKAVKDNADATQEQVDDAIADLAGAADAAYEAQGLKRITLTEQYGTYCLDKDLDFSETTGLTAYIAAGYNKTEGSLLMVKVTSVPAGTGLLLKRDSEAGGTFTAKMITSSPYIYSNLLTGTTAQTTVSASDFILGEKNDKVGFYRAETGTLAAGKAYLKGLAEPSGARMIINLVFDDDATAIENYRQEASTTNDWYTLDGRKLEGKPTRKGLYIKNGKKVVVR